MADLVKSCGEHDRLEVKLHDYSEEVPRVDLPFAKHLGLQSLVYVVVLARNHFVLIRYLGLPEHGCFP